MADVLRKPRVAFVCVLNACRSQMAEAFGRALASESFESVSAGTEPTETINADAVRLLREHFGIDASTQRSKDVRSLPRVDIVITMGCGVSCPYVFCRHRDDWGLADPTGRGDEAFLETMRTIRAKILALKARIDRGDFD